jgi:hypothetical protein
MAKYSDIKGFTVQTLSTDTIASQFVGGAWASSNNLNTARYRGVGTGTQTAGLVAGGYSSIVDTEQYNGSSWTEVNNLNTGRDQGGNNVGTYSATLFMSGESGGSSLKTEVEQWDGSSWTEIADVNTARRNTMGAGTTTAAIMAGGLTSTFAANTESWNGSSWTEVNDMNTARVYLASLGTTSTAAIAAAGAVSGATSALVEQWNGSAWTEIADVNTSAEGRSGSGSYTEGIVFAGDTPPGKKANTEHWNGSTWTEVADLATARGYSGGQTGGSTAGAAAAAFLAGGYTTTAVATTEEFTAPAEFNQIQEGQLFFNSTTNTFKETILDVPNGVWSSGGNLNTGRYTGGGYGSSNSATGVAGGAGSPGVVNENYNGTSWTEVNDLNTPRVTTVGSGTTTAALVYGDHPPNRANAESWDGTNFTEVADLNTARGYLSGTGTSNTANLAIGGFASPPTQRLTVCEQYDGSSWTEVGDLTRSVGMNSTAASSGSPYTSALCIGGYSATPPTRSALVEEWNGTSWTSSTSLSTGRTLGVGNGDSVNNILVAGGSTAPTGGETEYWNGSSWTEFADTVVTNEFRQSGGTASATNGILSGAPPGTPEASTEEWNALLSNKTITAS